jgi:cytoskeletal protein RodZ
VSGGEGLAAARHRAGLTVTQVSQQTRIRETIIRAIEHDDYCACGGDFYARGHIRAIAHVAGADPAPLIADYDGAHPAPRPATAADLLGPAIRSASANGTG